MSFLIRAQVEALRTLRETWSEEEIVIVGAAALRHHLGSDWRETQDLDLAIATSAQHFAEVLAGLSGWSRDGRIDHRWLAPEGVRIDIIPASADLLDEGEVIWPVSGRKMSLVGFRSAFEHGEATSVGDDLSILVAPLRVVIVLKMAAYLDRPAARERDLGDLAAIFERGVPHDDDERYAAPVHDSGISYEEAGPFVLGLRVGRMVDNDERRVVSAFVEEALDPGASTLLLDRFARAAPPGWRNEVGEARRRIAAFREGFRQGIAN